MLEIANGVYWCGVKDWTVRHFHGFELSTHRGTSYNSYYITGGARSILVDTVWSPFAKEFVGRLERDLGSLSRIDTLIINHAEPDHAGALRELYERGLRPDVEVYCTKACTDIIRKYNPTLNCNFVNVKTGDTIDLLGDDRLMFIEMKMIHWPDSMMTYYENKRGSTESETASQGILLSNDAFGQHCCASGLFNDEVDADELNQEAIKYYANILAPFTKLIEKKIGEVLDFGLDIDIIAPSHGIIWRDNPKRIVEAYDKWSKDYNDGSVVIAYDSLYDSTPQMAAAIAEGLTNKGTRYKIVNTGNSDMSDLMTALFCARGMIIGSSTINNSMHRSIAALLDDIRGHKLKGKIGAAFGSYGWSGEAPKLIAEELSRAGISVFGEPRRVQYAPSSDELKACVSFGEAFAGACAASVRR